MYGSDFIVPSKLFTYQKLKIFNIFKKIITTKLFILNTKITLGKKIENLAAFESEFARRSSRLFVMSDSDLPVSQFGFFDGR